MTNLDVIKHLANNNPDRLAELLDDIYCLAWNCGSYAVSTDGGRLEKCEIDDFNEFLTKDAAKSGFYYKEELEEWTEAINNSNECGKDQFLASVCNTNIDTIPIGREHCVACKSFDMCVEFAIKNPKTAIRCINFGRILDYIEEKENRYEVN